MAIIINSITRVNPAPCQHFRIDGSVDAVSFSKTIQFSNLPTEAEVPLREAVLRIMRWYNEEKGVTLAGFANKAILPDTLADAP